MENTAGRMQIHPLTPLVPAPPLQSTSSQPATNTQAVSIASDASPWWLQRWKDAADATASSVNVIALIVGAAWGYLLFVRRRQKYPRANVEHRIAHWPAGDRVVLHVIVRISNIGEVAIRLKSILARVQQLVPVPHDVSEAITAGRDPVDANESEITWPLVGERACDWQEACREVEPGETEECHFDFVLPVELGMVEVYSYLRNVSKRPKDIGWNTTTVYSVTDRGQANGNKEAQQAEDRPGTAQEVASAAISEAHRVSEQMAKPTSGQPITRQGPPKVRPPAAKPSGSTNPKR